MSLRVSNIKCVLKVIIKLITVLSLCSCLHHPSWELYVYKNDTLMIHVVPTVHTSGSQYKLFH